MRAWIALALAAVVSLAAPAFAQELTGTPLALNQAGGAIGSNGFLSLSRETFFDDFSTRTTAVGSIGAPIAPFPAYQYVTGPNGVAATNGQVTGGKWIASGFVGNGTLYAVQSFPYQSNHIGGTFGFSSIGGGGGGAESSACIVLGAQTPAAGWLNNLAAHVCMTKTQLQFGQFSGGVFSSLKNITYPTALSPDVDYRADYWVEGPVIHYAVAGLSGTFVNPNIPSIGLTTNDYWELFAQSANPPYQPYWSSVWGGNTAITPPSLVQRTVASWKLDDLNFNDVSGNGFTLTGANAPTNSTALVGNGVLLARASSQKLTIADTANLRVGNKSFTFTAWIKPNTTSDGTHPYFPVWSEADDSTHIAVQAYIASNQFLVVASPDGTFGNSTNTGSSLALSAGNNYFVSVTFDALARVLTACAGKAAPQTGGLNCNSTALSGVFNTANIFTLGWSGWLSSINAPAYFDGVLSDAHLFTSEPGHNGALTTAEITQLYNDGHGNSYPFGGGETEIAGGTLMGNSGTSVNQPFPSSAPVLGIPSATTGSLGLANSGSAFKIILNGSTVATADRTVSFGDPGANDSVAYLAATQTLTNKTLTSPTIGTQLTLLGTTYTGVTGTGNLMGSASPTMTGTAVFAILRGPTINGGNAAGSSLTLQSTSGVGTTDSIVFKTGSQVTALTIDTGQLLNLGAASSIATATAVVTIGNLGPTGTTCVVGDWLKLKDSGTNTRYVPLLSCS